MKRILVIRGGALGDFILTLPALKLLREAFAAAHLEILGYQGIISLAEMSGYANATRSIEYGPLSSFFGRGSELPVELVEYFCSFDLVISYLFDPDEIFATNLQRAGVRKLIVGPGKIGEHEHAARQLARPLEKLGLRLEDPVVWIAPNEPKSIADKLFAIHPGSGSARKNWSIDRFISLVPLLLRRNAAERFLLVCGEADEEQVKRLEASLPSERFESARYLPLPKLAARLQNCAAFLGHDSGISHLAAVVGTPSLLLFGPTDPRVWAPQNPQVRILRSSSLTMDGIEVAEVLESLGTLTN